MTDFNEKIKAAADKRKARLLEQYRKFQERERKAGRRGSLRQFAINKGYSSQLMYKLIGNLVKG